MKASIGDLRCRTKDILRALARREEVRIVSRGRLRDVIKPVNGKPQMNVQDHPFFNMLRCSEIVERQMEGLRGGRYRDL